MSDVLTSLHSAPPQRAVSMGLAALVVAALFVGVVPLGNWRSVPEPIESSAVAIKRVPPPPKQTPPDAMSPPSTMQLASSAPRAAAPAIELSPLPTDTPQFAGLGKDALALDRFPVSIDAIGEAPVFGVAELDRLPRLLSNPARMMPYELLRDDIRGQVRLKILIQPDGRAEVLEVVHADHERLVAPAQRFAEGCRFEPPMRNQIPVATAYVFPITF